MIIDHVKLLKLANRIVTMGGSSPAEAAIMKGLGHFPMSEDPQAFMTHLLPVLEKIARK